MQDDTPSFGPPPPIKLTGAIWLYDAYISSLEKSALHLLSLKSDIGMKIGWHFENKKTVTKTLFLFQGKILKIDRLTLRVCICSNRLFSYIWL